MGHALPIDTPALLTLPFEIRVKIYHACFTHTDIPILASSKDSSGPKRWKLIHDNDWSLLLTCKQINAEALPEYYRGVEFHCQRTSNAFQTLSQNAICCQNLRLLTIEPLVSFPVARDLLLFPALETVRMYKLRAFEPLGFNTRRDPLYNPLSYSTLRMAAEQTHQIRWPDAQPITQMKDLEDEYNSLCANLPNSHRTRPHFIIHLAYSYNQKTDHPDGWGGMTAKRMLEVEYDQTDNIFIVDDGESGGSMSTVVRADS